MLSCLSQPDRTGIGACLVRVVTEISAALAVDTEWFFPLQEGLDRWNASMLSGQATAALFRHVHTFKG